MKIILRYLEEFGEIDNERARNVLLLPFQSQSHVSRLFRQLVEKDLIEVVGRNVQKPVYKRKI